VTEETHGDNGVTELTGGAVRITLITRTGCHLCDDAKAVLERMGVAWTERLLDGDLELESEYGDRVPVVLLDGREHGYWRVEEDRLRRDLDR
jgi:glutaredoxin